jgi:uroporphyrin-III C-methyltransferase
VDNPKESDFFFNSLIIKDDLKISVSTSGKSPKLGQIIRDEIEKNLPKNIGSLLNDFGKIRENGEMNISEIEKKGKSAFGKVFLIGAGTGDPELLTIKAYKTIHKMDTIFFDHLISDEILEIIPNKIKIVSVGKQKGSHSKKQVEINKLMLDEVRQGKKVGRLKAGDPYIFGRGGEEFLYLVENGVSVEVISGISSAISNGIPPTFRGLSSSFTVVSAHLRGNSLNLDWIHFLKMENHTLIVLMGLSRVSEIFNESTKQNISLKTQVLIISNISRKNEKRISTTLENLIIDSKKADRPAIMIFGRVVELESQINKLG